jgi:hypothetical protein
MFSATFAVAVLPLRAVTVIMPSLTTKWPEIVLPFASLKLSLLLIFFPASPAGISIGHDRTTFVRSRREAAGLAHF